MVDRAIEIANPARLSVRNSQLVIAVSEGDEVTTPVAEIAVLVIAHPQVVLSQAVLSRIGMQGGIVVTCEERFLPASMMMPLQMHSIQAERLRYQAEMKLSLRKRLWQKIIRAKIRSQGKLLRELHGTDGGLLAMSERVRSGDAENLEAQAARRYWPLIFGNSGFRRGGEGPDQNRHLDYGYTLLRAATARALCGSGLHPSMGLRHHNRYDAFSLASDLMEPFRPVIDRRVFHWVQEHDPAGSFEQDDRRWLLGCLAERYEHQGEQRTLGDVLSRTARGLARAICERNETELSLPDELSVCDA